MAHEYKIGDLVRITQAGLGHKFQVGDVVRVTGFDDSDGELTCEYQDGRDYWYVQSYQVVPWHDEPTAPQNRPITFLSAVDALDEEHGLTVTECSVSEGVYTLVVVGE